MYYEEIPYYPQDFLPDMAESAVTDGLHGQPPYIDPIFDPDVSQEVSDTSEPAFSQYDDEVNQYNIAEDWMAVDAFWPRIPEPR